MSRYLGDEPCTSQEQIVRYLMENYASADRSTPMPEAEARRIVTAGAERIRSGVAVFRSNVYYLGDEAVKAHGGGSWFELPEPEEDEGDDGGH